MVISILAGMDDHMESWVEDKPVPFSPSSSGVLSLQGTSKSDLSNLDSEVKLICTVRHANYIALSCHGQFRFCAITLMLSWCLILLVNNLCPQISSNQTEYKVNWEEES